MHPIQRLFHYASGYRRDFRLATLYSVLNKFFDILPEVLIGAAVDVVVKGEQSFLARHVLVNVGITDTWQQLLVLGAVNVFVWGGESLTQYLYEVKWRQLAQDIQHDLRLELAIRRSGSPATGFSILITSAPGRTGARRW